MQIEKEDLKRRILAYNAGTISDKEKGEFWLNLTEICAYQIKKNKDDPAYYDFLQDMVIYILEHYLQNYVEVNPETGKEYSPLAFLLQSAYFTKLVLWSNKYKHESNEYPTLNTASADSDGNSNELVTTWSEDAYNEMWSHAWGKSITVNMDEQKAKKERRKKKKIELAYEAELAEQAKQEAQSHDGYAVDSEPVYLGEVTEDATYD